MGRIVSLFPIEFFGGSSYICDLHEAVAGFLLIGEENGSEVGVLYTVVIENVSGILLWRHIIGDDAEMEAVLRLDIGICASECAAVEYLFKFIRGLEEQLCGDVHLQDPYLKIGG